MRCLTIFDLVIDLLRRICGYQMPRLGNLAFRSFFKICPEQIESEIFPGITVRMNFKEDETAQATWWQGYRYEQPMPRVVRDFCSKDVKAFFDIGANYGFYSYLVLSNCPRVSVYAFEPNPKHFKTLTGTLAKNSLEKRFFPQQIGLSDENDELNLTMITGHGSATLAVHPDATSGKLPFSTCRVSVTTFDEWYSKNGLSLSVGQAVAKIDVDAFEVRILKAMQNALRNKLFKAVIVEVCAQTLAYDSKTPRELCEILAGLDYFPHDMDLKPILQVDDSFYSNVVFLPGGTRPG